MEKTYEQSINELEEIVKKMETGELDIDKMSSELKKAQELIAACKAKLLSAEEDIQKILSNDSEKNG